MRKSRLLGVRGINMANPAVRQFCYENALMRLSEHDFDGLVANAAARPIPLPAP